MSESHFNYNEVYLKGKTDGIKECINAIKEHWFMWQVGIIRAVIDKLEEILSKNEDAIKG